MTKKITIAKRREHLPKPTHVNAMAEINSQTARGAAIAATAYLDLLLRTILEKQMRPYAEIQDALFENRGALQDFSARIQVAFAFGAIGTGAYRDLCILRDIRNAFAHSAEALDFDNTDIATECEKLWYPRRIRYANQPNPHQPNPQTARERFTRAIELLADGLIELELQKPGTRVPTLIHMGPPWQPAMPPASPRKLRLRSSRGHPTATKNTGRLPRIRRPAYPR